MTANPTYLQQLRPIWKKTKISRWTAGNCRITEDTTECDGRPYRLESRDTDTEWFATLEDAKATAKLFNEHDLLKADNARLRAELAQRNGVWPPVAAFDRDDVPHFREIADFGEPLEANMGDDGRGIPRDEDLPY